MVVSIKNCECLNVSITEYDHKKNAIMLGHDKVQELEYKTGIFGLRECSTTCEFKLPKLIGKRVLHGIEIYRCHLCNLDFLAIYQGHRMLTDLVRAQDRHHKHFSSLFRVNIPPPLEAKEKCEPTINDSFDYCASKDRWFDIVETEKKRLYDELQKKLYDYIKKEEEIYNEKCNKIDQQCEKLKCVHADLLDSKDVQICEDEIARLTKLKQIVRTMPVSTLFRTMPVPPLPSVTENVVSVDDSFLAKRQSGTYSHFATAANDNELFLFDEDEMSACPSKEWVESRTSLGRCESKWFHEDVDEEDEYEAEPASRRKNKWRPSNMARSCAQSIPRPELASSPRSENKDSSCEGKSDDEVISFVGGTIIPPHTYVERLNKKIVPYSMPGRPNARE